MDGVLDLYLLGVATGLGVAAGVAAVWLASRGSLRALAALVGLGAIAGAVLIAVLAVGWALVGAGAGVGLGAFSVRRLAAAALPAAALGAAALAIVPLAGFAEALLAPFVGARLGRRAETRYAGLRVLAKD
jgi:hypothetical protein